MALTEDEAAKILLVRSVEECNGRAFSEQLKAEALQHAKLEEPGLAALKRYAFYLFDHLSPAYRSVARLPDAPTAWTLPICCAAVLAGLMTNLLGPARQVHVLRNPAMVLVAWNLLVYLALLLVVLRRRWRSAEPAGGVEITQRPGRIPPPGSLEQGARGTRLRTPVLMKFLMPGVWQFFHGMIFGFHEHKVFTRVIRHFSRQWFSVAAGVAAARWRRALHLASLFIAAGATAGMYLRGLFEDYQVVWASTFITGEATVSRIIEVIFGPSLWLARLLGLRWPAEINVAHLMTPQGDSAHGWIHLFAITVALAIVLPRLALAGWQSTRIRARSRDIALPLDHYYGEVIEGPLRSVIAKEVHAAASELSATIAGYVRANLYEARIVPLLAAFREHGGKIADLKSELTATAEMFLPELQSYIADTALPELERSLSHRIGAALRSIGSNFIDARDPRTALEGLTIAPVDGSELRVSGDLSRVIGVSLGTSIALTTAVIGGGFGQEMGIAVLVAILGTSGPIGFLLGLIAGAVIAATGWWLGKEKVIQTIEKIFLPRVLLRGALWPSRFNRLIEQGRGKCEESVRASIDDKMRTVVPAIEAEILARVRGLWHS